MSTTVLFVGVVVFAFVAGRFIDRFASKLLLFSGMEYLALGIALGPVSPIGPLNEETLAALDLFVSTVLGVVGFFVGLGARRGRGGTEFSLAGLSSAAGVVISVGLLLTGVLQILDPELLELEPLISAPVQVSGDRLISFWLSPGALWGGVTIGAAAAACSASLMDVAIDRFNVSPKRTRLLRTMASSAQLLAACAFGMAMAGHRAAEASAGLGLTLIEWALITVVAGCSTGILFSVFIGREDDPMRMLVATLGVVVFAAGVGVGLGVSPLFVNVIAGLTVAYTSQHAPRLHRALEPLSFPTTVLILLLAGATWIPSTSLAVWAIVPVYALARVLLRRFFTRLAVSTFVNEGSLGVGLGRGMVGQGVLAAAIAVAFAQRFPDLSPTVGTIILGGLVISDVLAMRALRRYLADVGEIQVATQPAPDPVEPAEDSADTPGPSPSESHHP